MIYTVEWLAENEILGETPFEDKDEAITHAREMFPQQQKSLNVTSVKVIDDNGAVIFEMAADDDAEGS